MKRENECADRATCARCGLERTEDDAEDYSPMQVILGEDLGWYSGDDCELCGPCTTEILERQ